MRTAIKSAHKCGFCSTGDHKLCPGVVGSGVRWACGCGCVTEPKCTTCKSTENVNPETWLCNDPGDCADAVAARRNSNPLHRMLEEIFTKHGLDGAKPAASLRPARSRAEVKRQARQCGCGCGTSTQGVFAPGHDARLRGVLQRAFAEGDIDAGVELATRGGLWAAKAPGVEPHVDGEGFLTRRVAERYEQGVESKA